MAKKKKPLTIDEICVEAIAVSAVEARQWATANAANVMAQPYRERAEEFYRAGAVRCWFDGFDEEGADDAALVEQMIVELPQTPTEKQAFVAFFLEQLGQEDSVDDPAEYVGERYAQFPFYG